MFCVQNLYRTCTYTCAALFLSAAPAQADMEVARDLMEAGDYAEARALDSLELITPRLTAEERARAEVLVDDYKAWMYPFR